MATLNYDNNYYRLLVVKHKALQQYDLRIANGGARGTHAFPEKIFNSLKLKNVSYLRTVLYGNC